MQKIKKIRRTFFSIVSMISVLIGLYACHDKKEGGILYLTDETHPNSELVTLKILKHAFNQSSEKNISEAYHDIVFFADCKWYMYKIPAGSHDIYFEYLENGTYENHRQEVIFQSDSTENEWVAIWLVDSSDHSIRTEYGSGDFQINNSLFK